MTDPGQTNSCPFCGKNFKVLGSHLRHCPQREGQDYQAYLSQKTREKKQGGPKKKPCAQCGKFFQRLDTHLRTSATCRAVPPVELSHRDHHLLHLLRLSTSFFSLRTSQLHSPQSPFHTIPFPLLLLIRSYTLSPRKSGRLRMDVLQLLLSRKSWLPLQ